MAGDAPRGLRGFLRSKAGLVVLLLVAIGFVVATFAYVSALLAVPLMILACLALPVWVGRKRIRTLALFGLVVLLAVGPLVTVAYAQDSLINPGAASSPGVAPFEHGGSVLQNATISPFVGSLSTNFTWSVQLFPRFLNASLNGTNWSHDSLQLYISTCPGATASYSPGYCPSGYSLFVLSEPFSNLTPPSNGTTVTFHRSVDISTIWSWQMELLVQNRSNATNPYRIELAGDPTYNGLEGPIIGGFATAYGALIATMYEADILYLGVPFYFILLLYWWYKQREARTKQAKKRAAQAMVAAGAPATPGSAGAAQAGAATAAPASSELACPNCGAVVYGGEAKCWKCGAALPAGLVPGTPLTSSGGTPPKGPS